MAFPTPSIGDILMLSQLAWRIGCAFTSGRAGAPAEFQEVENELKSLMTAITSLAESVDDDEGILARSDPRTREGLDKILGCCRQTLDNLDSFVKQYQEIRRPEESGGLLQQRSWKQILLRNWKTIMWTTEGGGIQSLRNMLSMHVQSILLTMQALQSRSLSRLEGIIEPVADQIGNMHNRLNGDLDVKIDEIHRAMLLLQSSTTSSPMIWPSRSDGLTSPARPPDMNLPEGHSEALLAQYRNLEQTSSRKNSSIQTPQMTPELSDSEFSAQSPYSINRHGENFPVNACESMTLPLEPQYHIKDMQSVSERDRQASDASIQSISSFNTRATSLSAGNDQVSDKFLELLSSPPSDLPPSMMTGESGASNVLVDYYQYPGSRIRDLQTCHQSRSSITITQHDYFKKSVYDNAVVLCEVGGMSIDYTQPDEDKQGEWKMVDASPECTIALVRKSRQLSSGALEFSTSIWALSNDRTVRFEHPIEDGEDVIPYTVWGNNKKVILRVPTELKFHDTTLDAKPLSVAKTAWVSYIFEDEHAATIFQNALIGRTLLLSVKTRRTMRIHDGITGAFAFAEQICGLENLRIFQDLDTGKVLALMHYSPQFRSGYMAFYLNSPRNKIVIQDDGDNTIRIKGINIPLPDKKSQIQSQTQRNNSITEANQLSRPKGGKLIAGAKIEFYTQEDKSLFMQTYKDARKTFDLRGK